MKSQVLHIMGLVIYETLPPVPMNTLEFNDKLITGALVVLSCCFIGYCIVGMMFPPPPPPTTGADHGVVALPGGGDAPAIF